MTNNEIIIHLHSLLKPVQQSMFENFFKAVSRKFVVHSSRRLGKTYFLCVLASVYAFRKSNSQIRYASVTQKAVKKMVHPIFKELFKEVPLKHRPQWNGQDSVYKFPNGSEIHVAGVNGQHSDDLRGTAADLCVVDEAAFVDDLTYLIDSVLLPQLLTTGGKLIMASSSPLSPAHQFTSYIQESRETGNYSSYDIHKGGYPPDVVSEFCKEAGGASSTTWRREYLNEIIVDSAYAIIPEFSKDIVQEYVASELDVYWHKYVSMDIGTKDFTAILFGVYDFKQARLFILDEVVINGPEVTTENIAKAIKQKELLLQMKPYRRVSDNNNLILLNDLGTQSGIHFIPTNKDRLEAMVNELRLWVQNKRLVVAPHCTQTIGCLEFGVWNKDRKQWGRSSQYKHFDALAALMYMVRNIDQNSNPIPVTHGTSIFTHYTPIIENASHTELKKIFNNP